MPITYDTGSAATSASSTATTTTTSITTAGANELLILFAFAADNALASAFSSTSPATGSGTTNSEYANPLVDEWREVADITTTTGADTANAYAHAIKSTAGATGTLQCTHAVASRHGLIVAAFKLPDAGAFPFPRISQRFQHMMVR